MKCSTDHTIGELMKAYSNFLYLNEDLLSWLNKKKSFKNEMFLKLFSIPAAGIEPARPRGHRILSPARLPVPPRRHMDCLFFIFRHKAVTGFEPVMKVLQTSALPLGYTAIFLVEYYSIKLG